MSTRQKPYKGLPMEGFIATWYANNTRGDSRGFAATAQAVAEQVMPGGKVLEVAPGPGYLAIEIAKLGAFQVSGLDISRSFVRIASENARRAGVCIDFRHGDAAQMPFPDESFDFVVCTAAFKNFADPVGAINEIHRVLKPGGKASIFDLRRDASREAIDAEVRGMKLSWLNTHLTRWTFRDPSGGQVGLQVLLWRLPMGLRDIDEAHWSSSAGLLVGLQVALLVLLAAPTPARVVASRLPGSSWRVGCWRHQGLESRWSD